MRRKSTVEFIEDLKEANPLIEVLGNYVNSRTKIEVKGRKCGHIWKSRPFDLLRGHGCPICRYVNNGKRTKKSNEQFVEELKIINPNIEPLDEYITSQRPITVRCMICQHIWTAKPNTLLNGNGCANCAGLKKKTSEEFIEELNQINSTIEVLGKYNGLRSKIHVRCKNCGHEWEPTAKALLIGRSCPECNKAGTSFMEQFILAAFRKELGTEQVLNRNRDTVGVELDIFIPSKAIAIEPGSWYWHRNSLKKDVKKRDQCRNMGIRVITIYDTYPNEKEKPFDDDCFVYEGQLNEPGYQRLKDLIGKLFLIVGIKQTIYENYWDDIIDQAHKGVAKTSHEEFVKAMGIISPSIEVNGVYHGSKEKIQVTCKKCGYQWNAIPNLLLRGSRCRSCQGLKKKTVADFKSELKQVNPTIELMSKYINTSTKIKVKNTTCGHEWEVIPSVLLKGHNCPICAGNRRKTHEQFVADLEKINPDVTVIGRYHNARAKLEIRCNQCGKIFFMRPNSLLNGHGCSTCNLKKGIANRCGKTRLKTTQEFISELNQVNSSIEVLGEYKKSKELIKVKCKLCGFEWSPQAGSLLSKHGCPHCVKNVKRKL